MIATGAGRAARGFGRVVSAAVVAVSLAARASPASGADAASDSAHYHLTGARTKAEADEWTRMLEAAWPQYVEFFGKAPPLAKGDHLNVLFFETLPEMQAAIKKAGGTPPSDAGGYYDPVSKAAYAWRQPSVWFTRALILHECTHQFHRLGRVAPNVSPPGWYGEGVAEHLSHHTWDGEHLRLGVVPMLSLEDWPGKALDVVKRGEFPLADVIDGKADVGRPECMHLVRWIRQADGGKLRAKFDDLAAKMDRGTKVDAGDFAHAIGPPKRVVAALLDWLPGVQQPWEPLFVDWDARGEAALRGSAPVMALCKRRAETRRVSAVVHRPKGGAWRAGVLLRYAGPEDYAIGVIDNAQRLTLDRRKDGAWQRTVDVELPASTSETWRVEAVREAGSVNFVVDGKTVGDIEWTGGSMGLAIDNCTIDFTEIVAQ